MWFISTQCPSFPCSLWVPMPSLDVLTTPLSLWDIFLSVRLNSLSLQARICALSLVPLPHSYRVDVRHRVESPHDKDGVAWPEIRSPRLPGSARHHTPDATQIHCQVSAHDSHANINQRVPNILSTSIKEGPVGQWKWLRGQFKEWRLMALVQRRLRRIY